MNKARCTRQILQIWNSGFIIFRIKLWWRKIIDISSVLDRDISRPAQGDVVIKILDFRVDKIIDEANNYLGNVNEGSASQCAP